MRFDWPRVALWALALAVLFGWLVWPTPWAYYRAEGALVRVYRPTGTVEVYLPTHGWLPAREADSLAHLANR